jgi:preprotein translocase subunit SecG
MEILQTILYIVIVVAAIFLILIILPQSNKGSDLGLFGGSTDMVFGSQKGNVLTRITGILATVVILGVFLMSVLRVQLNKDKMELEKKDQKSEIKTMEDLQNASQSVSAISSISASTSSAGSSSSVKGN